VTFDVPAGAYDRFMGRFSRPLAPIFLDQVELRRGHRALDVGCGPGALTAVLVERLGATSVNAVDPSGSFVQAFRSRLPAVGICSARAEALPFADGTFDAAVAQLVVLFLRDPVAGLREMARVTAPGGQVAACVWDHAGGTGALATFWQAAYSLDRSAPGESALPGARQGQLAELFERADIHRVQETKLVVTVPFASVEEWWEPFTLGVGPAGDYVAGLSPEGRAALRARCRKLLPEGPFSVKAAAWCVTGRA
jgi:SAM-dependent methyltransferase